MFEHLSKSSFKLIVLEKYGNVKIYANKSTDSLSKEVETNKEEEMEDNARVRN